MVRILKSELFMSVMMGVAAMALFEFFLGQGRISSGAIYVTLLISTLCLFAGLIAAATTGGRQSRGRRGK